MADEIGQADIRDLNISKLVKGFADELNVLKSYIQVTSTSARENRWFQKTAGFIAPVTTSGITGNLIDAAAEKTKPAVGQQTWTRNTSYIKKFIVESETISDEDLKDSSVNVKATLLRDLTRAVQNRVDAHIYDIITESQNPSDINNTASTQDGWDDTVTGDPIKDLLVGQRKIRGNSYNASNLILYINQVEHQNLMHYLISVKGSSVPQFASQQLSKSEVMTLLNHRVVVSTNAVTDYALQFIEKESCTYFQFTPTTAKMIEDPGIGTKIRVWEQGVAVLTDPKSVHLITDTVT